MADNRIILSEDMGRFLLEKPVLPDGFLAGLAARCRFHAPQSVFVSAPDGSTAAHGGVEDITGILAGLVSGSVVVLSRGVYTYAPWSEWAAPLPSDVSVLCSGGGAVLRLEVGQAPPADMETPVGVSPGARNAFRGVTFDFNAEWNVSRWNAADAATGMFSTPYGMRFDASDVSFRECRFTGWTGGGASRGSARTASVAVDAAGAGASFSGCVFDGPFDVSEAAPDTVALKVGPSARVENCRVEFPDDDKWWRAAPAAAADGSVPVRTAGFLCASEDCLFSGCGIVRAAEGVVAEGLFSRLRILKASCRDVLAGVSLKPGSDVSGFLVEKCEIELCERLDGDAGRAVYVSNPGGHDVLGGVLRGNRFSSDEASRGVVVDDPYGRVSGLVQSGNVDLTGSGGSWRGKPMRVGDTGERRQFVRVTHSDGSVEGHYGIDEVTRVLLAIQAGDTLEFAPGLYDFKGCPLPGDYAGDGTKLADGDPDACYTSAWSSIPEDVTLRSMEPRAATLRFRQGFDRVDFPSSITIPQIIPFSTGLRNRFVDLHIDLNGEENVQYQYSDIVGKMPPTVFVAPGSDEAATRYTPSSGVLIRYGFELNGDGSEILGCRFTGMVMDGTFVRWKINRIDDGGGAWHDHWEGDLKEAFTFWFWDRSRVEDTLFEQPYDVSYAGPYCTFMMVGRGTVNNSVIRNNVLRLPGEDWWYTNRRQEGTVQYTDEHGVERQGTWGVGYGSGPSTHGISFHGHGVVIEGNRIEHFKAGIHHDTVGMRNIVIRGNTIRNSYFGINWNMSGTGSGSDAIDNRGWGGLIVGNDVEARALEVGWSGYGLRFGGIWPAKDILAAGNKFWNDEGSARSIWFDDRFGGCDNTRFENNTVADPMLPLIVSKPDWSVHEGAGQVAIPASEAAPGLLVLTGDVELQEFSGIADGDYGQLRVVQDEAGGHSLTLASEFSVFAAEVQNTDFVAGMGPYDWFAVRWCRVSGVLRTWLYTHEARAWTGPGDLCQPYEAEIDDASFILDAAYGQDFTVTVKTNTTLSRIVSAAPGMTGRIRFVQGPGGLNSLVLGAQFRPFGASSSLFSGLDGGGGMTAEWRALPDGGIEIGFTTDT